MIGARALIAAVMGVVVGCDAPPVAQPQAAPDAAAIVRTMAATYLAATSYVDRGVVTTVFIEGTRRKTLTKTFTTALVRPNQFRFEFRADTSPRASVIWSDGTRTYTQLDRQAGTIDHGPDLGLALAGATGVSSGAAHTVPRLLLPEVVGGVGLSELGELRLAGSEAVDGHPCWRITGQLPGAQMTLWVDQHSHLLRRTFWPHHVAGPRPFDAEQTTTYDPIANRPVAAAALTPPDLAGRAPTVLAAPAVPPWVGIRFGRDGSTRVRSVIPGAPAERAGVKPGDAIVSIAGHAVRSSSEFIQHIRGARSGVALALIVSRDGVELRLDVTPERTPETTAMMRQILVDRPAPAFAATIVSGPHAAKLADHLGHVVILDFWATWCAPCKLTIPRLNAWQKKYGGTGLRIVGVSDEPTDAIRGYSTQHKLEYTVARDDGDQISRDYLVPAIPMLVVIDKQGVVRGVGLGAGDLDTIEALVVRLLN